MPSRAFVIAAILILAGTNLLAQSDDDPQNAVLLFTNGQELHEKGDLAGAVKLYERALKIVPEFPEAEYQRGMAELALKNPSEAEKSFRRAVTLRPDWSLALAKLGETLVTRLTTTAPADTKLLFDEANAVLLKAIQIDSNNTPAILALADLRLNTLSSPPSLIESLEKVRSVTDGKSNVPVSLWAVRAALELKLGKKDLARTSLTSALAIDPRNQGALLQLAEMAISDGDSDRASEIADRLSGSLPLDTIRLLKARILAAKGSLEDATKQLEAIEKPNSAAVELRARIRSLQATSPAELEKQLEANPKDAGILGRLCAIERRSEPTKALEYCRRASEAEPGNIHHALGFGAALVQAKQFEAAENILRKLIAIAPENSTAHANLATALFQLKRYPEAAVEFRWLTNNQPKSAGAYLFLGILYDQMTEYMDAMANYQQYLRLADPAENKLDIDKVNLRLPALQKLIKDGRGKHE